MRRQDREIKDFQRMTDIAASCDCCRLGLMDSQGAYILPMNFGYEEKDGVLMLYFHGACEGKKIGLIREQGVASFEMDASHQLIKGDSPCAFSYAYQSIMAVSYTHLEVYKRQSVRVRSAAAFSLRQISIKAFRYAS